VLAVFFSLFDGHGVCCGETGPERRVIVITDISQIKDTDFTGFAQLKTLDMRAVSVDAATVDALQAKLPGCTMIWNVPLGAGTFDSSSRELALSQDCAAKDLAMLRYFPSLTHVMRRAGTADELLQTLLGGTRKFRLLGCDDRSVRQRHGYPLDLPDKRFHGQSSRFCGAYLLNR
jgi:hypothetical protein